MEIDLTRVVNAERKRQGAQAPSHMYFKVDIEARLGNDKGILEVAAKDKRKKYGDIKLEYKADPAYKRVSVPEDD